MMDLIHHMLLLQLYFNVTIDFIAFSTRLKWEWHKSNSDELDLVGLILQNSLW